MARGTIIHRLMQSLPDIAPPHREAAAQHFVARAGAVFTADERSRFAAQALAVFADPRFAPLFGAGSRAEVPIVGRLRRCDGPGRPDLIVSGQIDRLIVTPQAVLIADFKTERNPPRGVEEVPAGYVEQLALYRAVLGRIHPDRPVRAALIWTELPALMELPAAALDAAFARLAAA
jgi:ATP-dependent helicase/nuclease subunit A